MTGCENQCAAYLGNKRCINETVNSSNHCELHRTKAKKLYLEYKALCDKVENLDLNKQFDKVDDRIEYIMECYKKLNAAYQGRLTHRNYAFVPECYDFGHLRALEKLNNQMTECEKIIESILEEMSDESSYSNSDTDSESDDTNFKLNKINRKILNYKQYRLQQEAETNQLIDHYIDENTVLLQKRVKLMGFIRSYVDNLYDSMDDEMDYFVRHIVTYNLVFHLYSCDYFSPSFKPTRCSDITCGCYVPYDVTLACACVLNNHSVHTYFQMLSEKSLSKYYELLLLNKNKIVPLMQDLMDLYEEHDDRLMFLKVHLLWHYDKRRLVLEPNTFEDLPKMSTVFAQTRLKNKFYHQKMQQEYLTGKYNY